ncbi:aspartate/glutamate racemase family protein [Pseudophaeobacter sp. MA21411-1]|nr:aspartate/glutamate racemase family protein [Pseudophaeobacter flagellatus]
MLETQFPRIPGDIGNALSWDFPVHYRVVRGATPDLAVRQDPGQIADLFIEAGRDLLAMGCDGITTSCGFLALIQDQVKQALGVPVATSSLMQIPMVQALLPPGKRVGVLTISDHSLTPAHLRAAGAPEDTPIGSPEGLRCFTHDILRDAAQTLIGQNPDLGALVLECTNMVPYAAMLRRVTGLPVFTIHSFITWFQAGLMPRQFERGLMDPRP